jgi:hypothetical protein
MLATRGTVYTIDDYLVYTTDNVPTRRGHIQLRTNTSILLLVVGAQLKCYWSKFTAGLFKFKTLN